ncbi:T9SS type A sorting domain-containing protein [Flavobacterium luminosum]|uniref:T9SS type A sorting domain-containing protein n=1 Tax=Flavobacterium luminosum TaxID=2949086 RepID=A0ABT0TM22_9FLAO|nr:T9SS type A sorting domain-containing protein [Flavobacterium sp. HXWNR70]MCL9808538.1 T9SS type A sorting domain-containing protein [Flavobacterium sp. HXWNR70]
MKLKLLFFALFWIVLSNAQGGPKATPKVATNYTFAHANGVYQEITGGTVLGTPTSRSLLCFIDPANLNGTIENLIPGPGFPIGFNFVFNENTFDRVAINSNGWLSFGKSSLAPNSVYSQISVTPLSQLSNVDGKQGHDMGKDEELRCRVAALGVELNFTTNSELRIETIGAAPNRIFVAQWKNFIPGGTPDPSHNYNFQIRLYETSNLVEVVYGSMIFGTSGYTAHVGLGGYDETDYNNREVSSSSGSTSTWASSVSGTRNNVQCSLVSTLTPPVVGAIFRWSPVTLSMSEQNLSTFTVYPTKVRDHLFIKGEEMVQAIELYDISGRQVLKERINSDNYVLDMSNFQTGVYIVKLTNNDKSKTLKVIKE